MRFCRKKLSLSLHTFARQVGQSLRQHSWGNRGLCLKLSWLRKWWVLGIACGLIFIGVLAVYRNKVVTSFWHTTQRTLTVEQLDELPQLQVGDLVLRFGVGADSYAIASVSHSQYSHIGIISATKPVITITHATTKDDAGADFNGVVNVPWQHFVEQATKVAIVRYSSLEPEQYPQLQAFLAQQVGREFSFDPQNPQGVYCTTLIEEALTPLIKLQVKRQSINTVLAHGDFLFPEAFLHDPSAQVIYVFPKAP